MRNYSFIILALLASMVIWLISNLSQTSSDIVRVRVEAHSDIVGFSDVSEESVTVAAAVSGSGFSLLRLALNKNKIVEVNIDPSDLVHREGEFFTISANALFKYASDIMGASVNVTSFLSPSVTFRFMKEDYKKVPVIPYAFISCKDQYMPIGDISVSSDSVFVYGDPLRLESIDRILTKQIIHRDVSRSVHGVVKLDVPAGMRLSQKQVTYFQDISRFVEYVAEAPVEIRNLPAGKSLAVFPSSVKVTYRFVFPISGNPAQNAVFYVDYNDFITSLSGDCMVKAENIPDLTIEWECSPQMCVCVETSQ